MATESSNPSHLNDIIGESNSSAHPIEKLEKDASAFETDVEALPIEKVEPNNPPTNDSETPESERRSKTENFLLMSAICMAVFLAAIDSVILTTSLPTIAAAFHTSGSGFAWIATSYLISNATSMPFWGKISEIFGRKPIFLIANAVFMIGSLISALSKDLNMLIGGRIIQGLGGGGLIVLATIIVTDLFSLRERAFFMALIGTTWSFASAIGPVIGGAFSEKASWRWCFYFNLPCDGTSLIIMIFFLEVHNPKTPLMTGLKAMDWIGALAITSGTIMFLLGLEFGGVSFPWSSPKVICLIIFGIFTMALFIVIQWKVSNSPIMPLNMFKSRSNICVLIVCTCHIFCYLGANFYIPLYYQAGLEYTPIMSGVLYLIVAIPASVILIGTGIYITKTSNYLLPMRLGLGITVIAVGLFVTFPPYRDYPRIVLFSLVYSLGMSPLFQSPIIALQAHLEPGDVSMGTSTFTFIRQLGAGISVAVGQVIFQSDMERKLPMLLSAGLEPGFAQTITGGNAIESTFLVDKYLNETQRLVVRTAVTQSIDKMWIFYTVIAGIGFLAGWGIQKKELSKKYVEYKTGLKVVEDRKGL